MLPWRIKEGVLERSHHGTAEVSYHRMGESSYHGIKPCVCRDGTLLKTDQVIDEFASSRSWSINTYLESAVHDRAALHSKSITAKLLTMSKASYHITRHKQLHSTGMII
jgi:hypothetical protein